MKAWSGEDVVYDAEKKPTKVVIGKSKTKYVGLTQQMDYIHRPSKYEDVCLYDWIRCAEKSTMSQAKKRAVKKTKEIQDHIATLEQENKPVKVVDAYPGIKHEDRDIKPLPKHKLKGGGILPKVKAVAHQGDC